MRLMIGCKHFPGGKGFAGLQEHQGKHMALNRGEDFSNALRMPRRVVQAEGYVGPHRTRSFGHDRITRAASSHTSPSPISTRAEK